MKYNSIIINNDYIRIVIFVYHVREQNLKLYCYIRPRSVYKNAIQIIF